MKKHRPLGRSKFTTQYNQRFGVSPAKKGNAHRPSFAYNLDDIFVLKDERILANDYTIVYNKRIFQLQSEQKTIIRPKDVIIVNTRLGGTIQLSIRKTFLNFVEINDRQKPKQKEIKMPNCNLKKPSVNSRLWAKGLPPLSNTYPR